MLLIGMSKHLNLLSLATPSISRNLDREDFSVNYRDTASLLRRIGTFNNSALTEKKSRSRCIPWETWTISL